jgi:hypothetical protein
LVRFVMHCVMSGASTGPERDSRVTTVNVRGPRAIGVKD